MAFDLEEFRRWDRQVDHGNDALVEAAIEEIELLRHFAVVLLEDDANQALAMICDNESLAELANRAENVET